MTRSLAGSFVCALTVVGLLPACSDGAGGGGDAPKGISVAKSALARNSAPSDANVPALGANNRQFAFDLLHAIASDHPNENLLFSPYSISTALAMTYEGARTDTASEMLSTLHFTLERPALHEAFNATDLALASRGADAAGADGTPFRLNVDNSFWMQSGYPVLPAFLDVLALNYGAGVYLADFRDHPEDARNAINGWVSDKTDKLIPELLPDGSIRSDTRFVLTNTVYFNASWQTKFVAAQTSRAPFHKLDGSQVSAPLMSQHLLVPYAASANWQAVALPYASPELSFVAILPTDGAYQDVESGLDGAFFDALQAGLSYTELTLFLPKLDFMASASLKQELEALRMKTAFASADFSGMTSAPIFVDDVIHQAVIELSEGGTIAAGATAVVFATKNATLQPATVVRFDHPFLFAIFDKPTGSLLFVGRVLDPTAS